VLAGGDCALSIGEADGHTNVPTLAIGSDGWEAYFSPGPKGATVGHDENPVGAYAAACIGVSELWKRLLAKHPERFSKVVIRPQLEPLMFSTLTYRSSPGPNPALPDKIDIGRLTIAGVGAGGGATVYTLASLRELAGPYEFDRSRRDRGNQPQSICDCGRFRCGERGVQGRRKRRLAQPLSGSGDPALRRVIFELQRAQRGRLSIRRRGGAQSRSAT
jgi:hypothetical protein